MGKVLMRELILVLLTGLFSWLAIPALLSQPTALPLLFVGLFLGITFMPMHALSLMLGKRISATWRMWIGIFAWLFAFLSNIKGVLLVLQLGGNIGMTTLAIELVPPMLGLILALMAALQAGSGQRGQEAAWSLFLYSLPMWVVRDVLVRLVGQNLVLILTAMLGGTLYMFLHGILRVFAPSPAEDEQRTEPLVARRAVPDGIVGLVEGTLHRSARPFVTTEQGEDRTGISVVCKPDDVERTIAKLNAAFGTHPFAATRGQAVKDGVEVVIRQKS